MEVHVDTGKSRQKEDSPESKFKGVRSTASNTVAEKYKAVDNTKQVLEAASKYKVQVESGAARLNDYDTLKAEDKDYGEYEGLKTEVGSARLADWTEEEEKASSVPDEATVPVTVGNAKSAVVDVSGWSPEELKKRVLDLISKKNGMQIERNVQVPYRDAWGRQFVMQFDGLIRLGGAGDMIVEVQLSPAHGQVHSRVLCEMSCDLGAWVRAYQGATGRRAALLFVLVGEFTDDFLRAVAWRIRQAKEIDANLAIDFDGVSLTEVGAFLSETS